MRTSLRVFGSVLAASAVFGLAAAANAAPAERELLGIRIWRTWREVLQKHGQPTRIEVGAVTGPLQAQPGAGGAPAMGMSAPMMGAPMMGGSMMGGAGRRGNKFANIGLPGPGASAPVGVPTGPMGMIGGMGGMSAPMMGGPTMGGSMMGGAGRRFGGALPGMEGVGLPGFGGPTLPGAPGMMGMTGRPGAAAAAPSEEGEITWIYEKGPLTFMFLFNKDGRVIQIQEFGYKGGSPTSRGVRLGDPLRKVYAVYGWADKSETTGDQITLDYSHKAHVVFQLIKNKVVGITVALTERSQIPTVTTGTGGIIAGGGEGE
ncbi:MAG: hypothetical protein ACP5VE_04645 [Chthonomonadales bacterium]